MSNHFHLVVETPWAIPKDSAAGRAQLAGLMETRRGLTGRIFSNL